MSEKGEPFFNVSDEYYDEYFKHAARLLPGFRRVYPQYSGICHFMLFQKPVLEDLLGWDSSRIRFFFEANGLVLREWTKARTDTITLSEDRRSEVRPVQ